MLKNAPYLSYLYKSPNNENNVWELHEDAVVVYVSSLIEDVRLASKENPIPGCYSDVDDLISYLNPENISETAGAWEDYETVEWLYTNVLEPKNIDAIQVIGGFILLDPELAKSA